MALDRPVDFIVVGGGTAGLVVAARLAEDPTAQVLVIEAGADQRHDARIRVPGRWFTVIGSEVDWNFTSIAQAGLDGRAIGQPQGRVLGGSSAINGQAWIAPSAAVVDAWGELGNPEWSWEKLAPYWRKCHTLVAPAERQHREHLGLDYLDEKTCGRSGPLQAYYATPMTEPLAPAWSQTFRNLGFAPMLDPASGRASGGFSSPASIDARTRERSYSANAHWREAEGRKNVRLLCETLVTKIMLEKNEETGLEVAVGVEVSLPGGRGVQRIAARREVILAAGSYQSPKLLELSGIGDAEILQRNDIQVRVNCPGVGSNLQDHLMTGISFEVNDGVQTLDALRQKDAQATQAATDAYQERKEGPLTLGGINYFSFMPIVPSQEAAQHPFARMLAAHPIALDTQNNPGLHHQYEYLRRVMLSPDQASGGIYLSPRGTTYAATSSAKDYGISNLPGNYLTIGLSLLQPFSRGSSHVVSAKPHDPPCIDPQYLSNPLDVEVAAAHLAFIERLAATRPLSGFLKEGGRRNAEAATGKEAEAAKAWVRQSVLSNWHACGTCSMMKREWEGVVSQRLIVYGTQNLRVVDASVMPIIPRGNIQSSVYMLAERAADIVKEDWGLKMA